MASNFICAESQNGNTVLDIRPCRECGAEMHIKIKRDVERKQFCSRQCRSRFTGRSRDMSVLWAKNNTPEVNKKKAHHKENHPNWKPVGSKQIRYDGYVKVKMPDGSWQYEHRVITGADPELIVHHKDENKGNNDATNLVVMSLGEHSRLHGRQRTDFGRKWSEKFDACVSCGGTERKNASNGICDRCYQRKGVRDAFI